jgi:hypothetical protein
MVGFAHPPSGWCKDRDRFKGCSPTVFKILIVGLKTVVKTS